jgi:hypothetical protein
MRRALIVGAVFVAGMAVPVVTYLLLSDDESESFQGPEDDGSALSFVQDGDLDKRAFKRRAPILKPRDLDMDRAEFVEARVAGATLGTVEGDDPGRMEGFHYVGLEHGAGWSEALAGTLVNLEKELVRQKVLVTSHPMVKVDPSLVSRGLGSMFKEKGDLNMVFFPVAYEPEVEPPLVRGKIEGGPVFVRRGLLDDDIPQGYEATFAKEIKAAGWTLRADVFMRISNANWKTISRKDLRIDLIIPVEPKAP